MVKQLKLPEVRSKETKNKEIKGHYELPEDWGWVRLGDVCEINPRDKNLRDLSLELEVTFIPMKAVDYKKGEIISPEIRQLKQVIKGYTQFKEGDVIFAKITPCMENGKVAIARKLKNDLGFGSTEFHVLRSSSQIISEYVYFYIRQPSFRDKAQMNMTGTVGQLRVPTHFMKNVEIPLPFKDNKPNIEEQTHIISLLESTLSKANKAKELLKDSKKAIDKILSAAIKKVIPTEEPLPKGWKWVKLGDVCDKPQYGLTANSTNEKVGPVYLRITDIDQEGNVDYSNVKFVSIAEEEFKKFKLEKGDIVIARSGATAGKSHLFTSNKTAVFASYLIRFKPIYRSLTPEFLFYFLKSNFYWDNVNQKILGMAQPNLNAKKIQSILIPLPLKDGKPDIEEQNRIVSYLNSVSERVEKLKKFNDDALEKVEKISASILSKAFRGELSQGVSIGVKTNEYDTGE
jgi:type I restriction enzyme S subunit